MYFDAVVYTHNRIITFNGTSEETRKYLLTLTLDDREKLHVVQGRTLNHFTCEEYLRNDD